MQFVYTQTAVMLAAILGLAALGVLTLELFFVVSFLGFLVVTEFTAPVAISPAWRRRLRWVAVLGFVALMVVVAGRAAEVLDVEVL